MRLFTAIIFDEDIKDSLIHTIEKLKSQTAKGSFTARNNLHLTLNFIGETDRLELVKEAMQKSVSKTNTGSFELSIGGFGRFKRREGDICFAGVKKDRTLWDLQKELSRQLNEAGFDIEDQEYKPHLTLSRRTLFVNGFNEAVFKTDIPDMSMTVSKISLMKSERIQGKLVYTEIYFIEI